MSLLTVATPEFISDGQAALQFNAEQSIDVQCAQVNFSDNSVFLPTNGSVFGFHLYRKFDPATTQIWDEELQSWQPENKVAEPTTLAYKDDLWQMVIVPLGLLDQAGQAKFATDLTTSYPKYFVRCVFEGADVDGTAVIGTSAPSKEVEIYAAGVTQRASLTMEPEDSTMAEEIRLFLKDAALTAEQGTVAIRQQGAGFEIEVAVSGANVLLNSVGDIVLTPQAGRQVQISGDLNVSGDLGVSGNLDVVNDLNVDAKLTVKNGLVVSGMSTFNGNVAVQGSLSINGVTVIAP